MKTLIFHRKFELFKKYLQTKVTTSEKSTIVPDSFSHACIIGEMKFTFYLFQKHPKIIQWRHEQCLNSLVYSFEHSQINHEERIYLLTQLMINFNYKQVQQILKVIAKHLSSSDETNLIINSSNPIKTAVIII